MWSPTTVFLAEALSRLIGWTYVTCWSLSFYPQAITNYRRRSTTGLAIDLFCSNVLGYLSYVLSTSAFYFSPLVRAQYAARNQDAPEPTVRFNDVVFAAHALVLSSVTFSQFFPRLWHLRVGSQQRPSWIMLSICSAAVCAFAVLVSVVVSQEPDHGRDPAGWAWIDVAYALGNIKLLVTLVKYTPQAWVNYKRKSTIGFSIIPVLLDTAGSILSLIQLAIDSALQSDWSGLTGNPSKLWLGNISLFFDAVFLLQHYVFFPKPSAGEDEPLLAPSQPSLASPA